MTSSGEGRVDSSAAEKIVGNEDLLTEILFRLPAKSLVRFESVSKKWLSLISHPHFAQNYTRRRNPNSEPSGLMLSHDYGGYQFTPFNGGDDEKARVRLSHRKVPKDILISQSCNGLLICYHSTSDDCFKYFICNPTIRRCTIIRFPSREFENSVVAVNLAFEPLKSPHYKLLCVQKVNEQTPLTYQIHIYSSESRTWRPPISADPLTFTAPDEIYYRSSVYCNGAFHWESHGETSLYFDMNTECLKTMPMPPFKEGLGPRYVRYLGESMGHLHLIVAENVPSSMEFDILEIEADYSGWFVRYHVNLEALKIAYPDTAWHKLGVLDAFSALCVARAENEKESTLVLYGPGEVICYNLSGKTSKKLCDVRRCKAFRDFDLCYGWSDAYQYIETLYHV